MKKTKETIKYTAPYVETCDFSGFDLMTASPVVDGATPDDIIIDPWGEL